MNLTSRQALFVCCFGMFCVFVLSILAASRGVALNNLREEVYGMNGSYAAVTTCVNTYVVLDKADIMITFDTAPDLAVIAPRYGNKYVKEEHLERGVCAWYLVRTGPGKRPELIMSNKKE